MAAYCQGGGQQQEPEGIARVIALLKRTEPWIKGRDNVGKDFEERDVLSVSALLLKVVVKVLQIALDGVTNPYGSLDEVEGSTLFKMVKAKLSYQIGLLHSLLANDISIDKNRHQTPIPTVTRPGGTLDQSATLTCPSCQSQIQASFGVRVEDSSSPSVKVSVNVPGQEDQKGITCPNCQRRVKTQLQVGADGVGNSVSVRVSLDEDKEGSRKEKLTNGITTLINDAMITMYEDVENERILDRGTFDLVNKCLQASQLILYKLDDESFRTASWYQEDDQFLSVMDKVQRYIQKKLDLLGPTGPEE